MFRDFVKFLLFSLTIIAIAFSAGKSLASEITYDQTVSPQVQTDIEKLLNFLKRVQLSNSSPLNKKIFGSRSKDSPYYRFVEKRVRMIRQTDSTQGGYLMFAGADQHPQTVTVTANYLSINPKVSDVMKALVLIHEARHNDSSHDHWAHWWCPYPFLNDQGQETRSIFTGELLSRTDSCDKSAIGAIGVSIIAARNIERFCSTCTTYERTEARKFADDMMNRIIDPRAQRELAQESADGMDYDATFSSTDTASSTL